MDRDVIGAVSGALLGTLMLFLAARRRPWIRDPDVQASEQWQLRFFATLIAGIGLWTLVLSVPGLMPLLPWVSVAFFATFALTGIAWGWTHRREVREWSVSRGSRRPPVSPVLFGALSALLVLVGPVLVLAALTARDPRFGAQWVVDHPHALAVLPVVWIVAIMATGFGGWLFQLVRRAFWFAAESVRVKRAAQLTEEPPLTFRVWLAQRILG